jgi:MFS family permease
MAKKNRELWIFSIASFLNDFGSDMIYPIWPIFLSSVLGANMAVIGLVDGIGDAIVSLSQAASGYVSDRLRKRKFFVYAGYLMGSASRIGYAISSTWQQIIPFKILDRAGKIRGAPRDAIIADLSTRKNRGRNFGILQAMDNLGAVFGILLTIAFFGILGYQNLFLIAAIPSVIAALLVIFIIKERKTTKKIFRGIKFHDMNPNLRLLFIANAIFALGAFSYSFLLVFANKAGFSAGFVPVLYLIFTLVASISSIPFGKLSDKIGRKAVLAISYGLWAAVCIGFAFSSNPAFIVLAFMLYGLHRGAFDTVQRAFVAELAPKNFRASVLGGFQLVVGVVALPASLMAGILWDSYGMIVPFSFSILLSVIALALLSGVGEPR